jgi:NAD-specific glutamate dehydrogenase
VKRDAEEAASKILNEIVTKLDAFSESDRQRILRSLVVWFRINVSDLR